MIPLKTTLTGAIGVRAGLGRDTLTIDLTEIPSDARSIAIKGDNGTGKSTLLNLGLHPWRNPPHIDDIYSEFGPEGARELEFEHGGERYGSVIKIRQPGKTKSMSASLRIHRDGDWQPVTLPDGTFSDGKNGTYDACLEHILGPQSLYFMSAFRHQNAAPLASHGDPKGLMRDLLALDEPERLADQAKSVARELRRALDARRSDIERIEQTEHRLVALETELQQQNDALPGLLTARREADDAVADVRERYNKAREATAENAEVRRQRDALIFRLNQARQQAGRQITQIDTDLARAQQQLATTQQTAARMPEVEAAEQAVVQHRARIEELEATRKDLQDSIDEYHKADADVARLQSDLSHIANDGKRLAATCEDLVKRHGYVQVVPCKGEYPDCPALKDAVDAGARLPDEEHARDAKRSEWEKINEELKSARARRETYASAKDGAAQLERDIQSTRTALELAHGTASQRGAVESAHAAQVELQVTISELTGRRQQAETEGTQAAAAIQADIDALPPLTPEDAVTAAGEALQQAETKANEAAQAVETCNARIAALQAERETLQRQLADAPRVKRLVDRLNDEIADWSLLSMALRGVIDLSIEDAGPAISALANQLLNSAYGPRFTTRIVTQRQQTNGRLVETFDISVIDADSGIESSFTKKSGGESVWLDKAMRDAVGLYHQDAAGVHYESLFADEAEDGLTEERKLQFYRMDRAALEMGGYRRKFFVSHTPAAWEMADYVIDLGRYRVQ